MSDSESNLLDCDCGCTSLATRDHSHNRSSPSAPQLKNALCSGSSSSSTGLILPSSNKEQGGLQHSTAIAGGRGGAGDPQQFTAEKKAELRDSASSLVPLPDGAPTSDNNNQTEDSNPNRKLRTTPSGSSNSARAGFCCYCASKMLTCRVLIALLLVKCIILSFIIPAHLVPTTSSSEYPPHEGNNGDDYDGLTNGHGNHHAGDEDGFDNIIMLEDQPLSLMSEMKSEIMNLVEPFDLRSQAVTNPDTDTGTEDVAGNGAGVEVEPTTESGGGDGDGGDDDKDDKDEAGEGANGDGAEETTESSSAANGGDDGATGEASSTGSEDGDGDGDKDEESPGEDGAGEAEETTEPGTGNASAEGSSASGESSGSCSDSSMKTVLQKIEGLLDAVKNIDVSIDKMETLVQSTMIDERVYKCLSAIGNGNYTQAQKYWKQILRYLPTPQKQAAILNQLIRDAYGGSEDQILPTIQFISQTTHYYGYYTLFKELPKHNHLYRNTAIFTLGHHVKKSCGKDSPLYKSLPSAVQSVFGEFFTLQNKHNKGYLYYAKRCVAKHYFHCLDVLTKRIDPYVLDGLADDSEEKRRYHWKLNATDTSVTKFFILNHDKYWTYRLQDLNNSPRFKMEEAGSNAEIELAHFQLKLHTDDELMIQVRDSEDYLEEEDFKSDKAEVRLHSFHQADGIPDSPRMYWLANPVASSSSSDDDVEEPDSCNIDLALVSPPNGNGNGASK